MFLPVCPLGDWEPSCSECKPKSLQSLDDLTISKPSQPSHGSDIDDQWEFHNLFGWLKRVHLLAFGPGFQ